MKKKEQKIIINNFNKKQKLLLYTNLFCCFVSIFITILYIILIKKFFTEKEWEFKPDFKNCIIIASTVIIFLIGFLFSVKLIILIIKNKLTEINKKEFSLFGLIFLGNVAHYFFAVCNKSLYITSSQQYIALIIIAMFILFWFIVFIFTVNFIEKANKNFAKEQM